MKLWIASDHAGIDQKKFIKKSFPKIEWLDEGPQESASVDYPDFAQKTCKAILAHRTKEELLFPCGILICGSGVGMAIAANRVPGIRAVAADRVDIARLSRQHNASNVLCLGARINSDSEIISITREWLTSEYEGGRHQRRIEKLDF